MVKKPVSLEKLQEIVTKRFGASYIYWYNTEVRKIEDKIHTHTHMYSLSLFYVYVSLYFFLPYSNVIYSFPPSLPLSPSLPLPPSPLSSLPPLLTPSPLLSLTHRRGPLVDYQHRMN